MNHRPVCVKCQTEFKPYNNNTAVMDFQGDSAQEIWMADTWKCPKCKKEVILGFGEGPAFSRGHGSLYCLADQLIAQGYTVHFNYPKDEFIKGGDALNICTKCGNTPALCSCNP